MTDELPEELGETFLEVLAADVIRALERQPDSQSNRRDLMRASFAAIEGLVWVYRKHVEGVAKDLEEISPITEMAFSELTYRVTENGMIEPQTRFVTITAMIKFTTNEAQKLSQELKVDFGVQGWADLLAFMAIRNRITHPKTLTALHISDDDLKVAQSAFFWLLKLVGDVMESTTTTSAKYLEALREISALLISGNEQALALYRMAVEGKLE
jgi:hypothetical protein